MKIVWHYTYHSKVGQSSVVDILRTKVLLPPALIPDYQDGCPDADAHADRKLLLFSENEFWEPASYRGITVNGEMVLLHKREEYAKHGIAIFRIGVDAAILTPYLRLTRKVGMNKGMAASLFKLARELGANPYQWYGTTSPVPLAQWRKIEWLRGDVWTADLPEIAAMAKGGAQ